MANLREAAIEAIREYDAWVQDIESVVGRQPKTTFMDNLRAALDTPDGWISVEERLPEPLAKVQVFIREDYQSPPAYDYGQWLGGSWELWNFAYIEEHEQERITHWQPLPKPPKSREVSS